MPLQLTPVQTAAAEILAALKRLKSQYEQPMMTLDAIMNGIIALPSDDLAALGNVIGETDLTNLLAAHAAQVTGANQLAQGVETIIASIEQRDPAEVRQANASSIYERLAEQGREIVNTGGVFTVENNQ